MKFAVDIDGVVANIMRPMIDVSNDCNVTLEGDTYRIEPIGIRPEKQAEYVNALIKIVLSHQDIYIKPYEHATEVIKTLDNLGSIVFLTARRDEFNDGTLAWLRRHFPVSFAFSNKSSRHKAQFILEEEIDVLVEDRLRTANHAAGIGVTTYLINRPWNTNRNTHPDVRRVARLEDLPDVIFADLDSGVLTQY